MEEMGYFRVEPFFSAFGFLSSLLVVLEFFDASYMIVSGGQWVEMGFVFNYDLLLVFVFLYLFWVISFILNHKWVVVIPSILLVVFLQSLDLVFGLAVSCLFFAGAYLYYKRDFEGFLFWLFGIVSVFLFCVCVYWVVLFPLGIEFLGGAAFLEQELYYVLAHLSPYVIILVIVYSVGVFLSKYWGGLPDVDMVSEGVVSRKGLVLLGLLCLAAVFVSTYPYLNGVDPSHSNLGVDLRVYEGALELIDEGFNVFHSSIIDGSRPVVFWFLLGIRYLFGLSNLLAVRYAMIICSVSLVLSSYYFSFNLYRDEYFALFSSFFVLFGFPVIIGLYGGFLSNMLGLNLMFLAFGAFLHSLRTRNRWFFVVGVLVSVLGLLSHPWTFMQYFGVFGLFLVTYLVRHGRDNFSYSQMKYIARFILLLALVVIREYILGGISAFADIFTRHAFVYDLGSLWYSINIGSWFIYGGLFANIVVMLLVLYSFINLRTDYLSVYFVQLFFCVTSIVWIFGGSVIKDRLMYNSPFWFFSAYGLLSILRSDSLGKSRYLFGAALILYQLCYAFRSLAIL